MHWKGLILSRIQKRSRKEVKKDELLMIDDQIARDSTSQFIILCE